MNPDVNWKGWKGRQLEGLNGTSIESGRQLEGLDADVGLEGTLDPDIVAGRVRSGHCCWKGRWIRTLLLEETLLLIGPIDVVVDCPIDVVVGVVALISFDVVVAVAGW